MSKEEVKALIDEEVDKKLLQHGLIKEKKSVKFVNYYNPMYMRDTWYGD